MTLFATEPQIFSLTNARAAVAKTYHQLNLFGGAPQAMSTCRRRQLVIPRSTECCRGSTRIARLRYNTKSFRDMRVETHGEFGGNRP